MDLKSSVFRSVNYVVTLEGAAQYNVLLVY